MSIRHKQEMHPPETRIDKKDFAEEEKVDMVYRIGALASHHTIGHNSRVSIGVHDVMYASSYTPNRERARVRENQDEIFEEIKEFAERIGTITSGDDFSKQAEHLGGALMGLSKDYRLSQMTGLYTSYEIFELAQSKTIKKGDKSVLVAPWYRRRIPHQIGLCDAVALESSKGDEVVPMLAEILDPHRYSGRKIEEEAYREEQDSAALLLSKLPSGTNESDFMAVEAIRYFAHENVNRPDLIEPALGMLSTPGLQEVMRRSLKLAEEHRPRNMHARIEMNSKTELSRLVSERLKQQRPQDVIDEARMAVEEQESKGNNNYAVTINIKIDALTSALFDTGRLLTVNDTFQSNGNFSERGSGQREVQARSRLHEMAEGMVDRPVYGALAFGEGQMVSGAAGTDIYGDCVITLKQSVVESRTAFSYGDSKSVLPSEQKIIEHFAFDEAKIARWLLDADSSPNKWRYIEAQVMGGVDMMKDVESITVPYSAILILDAQGLLDRARQAYPELGINLRVSKENFESMSQDDHVIEQLKRNRIELVIGND